MIIGDCWFLDLMHKFKTQKRPLLHCAYCGADIEGSENAYEERTTLLKNTPDVYRYASGQHNNCPKWPDVTGYPTVGKKSERNSLG